MHVVGRDQRQAAAIGEIEKRLFDAPLGLLAVTLQLDIEPAVEQRLQTLELMGRGGNLARQPAGGRRALPVLPTRASRPSVLPSSSESGKADSEPALNSRCARLTSRIRLRYPVSFWTSRVSQSAGRTLPGRRDATLLLAADAECRSR